MRCKNYVPRELSPVYAIFYKMEISAFYSGPPKFSQILKSAKQEIVSLYRDGKAAPGDRDQDGRSHTQVKGFRLAVLWLLILTLT